MYIRYIMVLYGGVSVSPLGTIGIWQQPRQYRNIYATFCHMYVLKSMINNTLLYGSINLL